MIMRILAIESATNFAGAVLRRRCFQTENRGNWGAVGRVATLMRCPPPRRMPGSAGPGELADVGRGRSFFCRGKIISTRSRRRRRNFGPMTQNPPSGRVGPRNAAKPGEKGGRAGIWNHAGWVMCSCRLRVMDFGASSPDGFGSLDSFGYQMKDQGAPHEVRGDDLRQNPAAPYFVRGSFSGDPSIQE